MHTVRWVSQQLGLAPGTLRGWEQRYGIVHPTRTEGGYRLYDDDDLDTLQAMADLVAGGMQPAQAAEQIRSGRVTPSSQNRLTVGARGGLPDHSELIAAALGYDSRALEAILDAAFAAAGFEYVIDEWLMPALVTVGQAWVTEQLDIAQEHFISAADVGLSVFDDASQDSPPPPRMRSRPWPSQPCCDGRASVSPTSARTCPSPAGSRPSTRSTPMPS